MRLPLPSQALHPIVQPWLNQNVLCPESHTAVPLVQGARLGSMVPVGGCLPPDHGANVASIEFRAGGLV